MNIEAKPCQQLVFDDLCFQKHTGYLTTNVHISHYWTIFNIFYINETQDKIILKNTGRFSIDFCILSEDKL